MPEDKTPMADAAITEALAMLPGWRLEGICLRKDFLFGNFKEINAFLPHLARSIVEGNHHPDVEFFPASKRVTVRTTTHSAHRLTHADLNLARSLENWPRP